MTSALVPWRGRQVPDLSQISRYNLTDFFGWLQESFKFGGHTYSPSPAVSYTYGRQASEPIGNNFAAYVQGLLYADGVVASVEQTRVRIFSQVPLLFQEISDDGRPAQFFDDPSLDILRKPWPGATMADLMTRELLFADFGGNSYKVLIDDEVVVLRPDWVEIVLAERLHNGQRVGYRQVGIAYYEGGLGNGDPVVFSRGEYSHFAPMPDPLATYRGMSWLTPIIREVQSDIGATSHNRAFWENAATPNLAVSLPKEITPTQFTEFVDQMDAQHRGAFNAYKTLYTAGGADVTVVGANMQQMDFTRVQGKLETRIANAAGVHPVLVGLSEGMQGSSLNAGNYQAAKRSTVEITFEHLWQSYAGSTAEIVPPPRPRTRLWFDGRDTSFLHEDAKDAADIEHVKTQTINALVMQGFDAETVLEFIVTGDFTKLKHTGLVSVQLLPPGAKDSDGDGHVDSESEEEDQYQDALKAARAEFDQGDGISRAYYNIRHPAGAVGGGRFRKISDIIVKALEEWMNGGGDDDPLDEFTQPQLKAAATQLGLDPPPRTRAPALRKMLLDKARADVRAQKDGDAPEKPDKPEAPAENVPTAPNGRPWESMHPDDVREQLQNLPTTTDIRKVARLLGVDVPRHERVTPDRNVQWNGDSMSQFVWVELYRKYAAEGLSHQDIDAKFAGAPNAPEPASPQDKARARQARIDSARGVATSLAEALELANNDASPEAYASRVTATAKRLGTPDSVRDALLNAQGDPVKLRAAVRKAAKAAGLTQVGDTRKPVPFDRALHKAIDGDITPGALVSVVRPGFDVDVDGERVRLSPASVIAAPEKKTAPRKAAPKARTTDPAVREVEVDNLIREAYREAIADGGEGPFGRPTNGRMPTNGSYVSLDHIRRRVGDRATRAEVDAALLRFARDGSVQPQEDQKRLTPSQRAAAISYGRTDMHMIALDDPSPRPLPTEAPVKAPRAKAAPRKAAPEPAGTVRAEGFASVANTQLRVVADGNGGYVGQRKSRATGEWHDDPSLGTGNTPKDITTRFPKGQWRNVRPPAPAAPKLTQSDILADPSLSPAQKRARLRSLGLSKAEIDALVPLAPRKSAAKAAKPTPDEVANRIATIANLGRNDDATFDAVLAELAGVNDRDLRKIARLIGSPAPTVWKGDEIRKHIAQSLGSHGS